MRQEKRGKGRNSWDRITNEVIFCLWAPFITPVLLLMWPRYFKGCVSMVLAGGAGRAAFRV